MPQRGGIGIDQAVSHAFLEALTPAALEATTLAVQQLEFHHDVALSQWRLEVERARYEADRAERQYQAVDPLCHVDRNVASDAAGP